MEERREPQNNEKLMFAIGLMCGMLIFFIAAVIACIALGIRPGRMLSRGKELTDRATIDKITSIRESIADNFYRTDVEEDALREGLYRGLVDALDDPYSVYYTEEEMGEIMESIEGVYEGIGAYLMLAVDADYPVITGTIAGSPAEAAGLQENDVLAEVEGESTKGWDLSTVVSRVRGEEGTVVNLTILRNGKHIHVSIERAKIESPTVETEDPVDGIGYLRITEFDDVTPEQFSEGIADLQAKGMRGLLLDLRSNTGGNLDAVCEIADELLPEGVVVYTLDRDGNREDFYSDADRYVDFPIVVLTNGYTASASEILAGAIRDYGMGKLVGTTTYGKGVV
ncbi:MAG: S41 family peptidase, partial [Lachnospiraceae bacterium]|nr:S41 family peptidase [Lachnospiraceae bacterium]